MSAFFFLYKKDAYIEIEMLLEYINKKSPFPVNGIIRDDDYCSGCYYNPDPAVPYEFYVGLAELNEHNDTEVISDSVFVGAVISVFHEYQHVLQSKNCFEVKGFDDDITSEINISKYFSYYFVRYWEQNYLTMPHEIAAERYAIQRTRAYLCRIFPNLRLDEAILDYINKRRIWFVDTRKKPRFETLDEALTALDELQMTSYNKSLVFKKPSDNEIIKLKADYDDVGLAHCAREVRFNQACRENKIKTGAEIYLAGLSYINAGVEPLPSEAISAAQRLKTKYSSALSKFAALFSKK